MLAPEGQKLSYVSGRKAWEQIPNPAIGQVVDFLEIVGPFFDQIDLNKRCRWFLKKFGNINFVHIQDVVQREITLNPGEDPMAFWKFLLEKYGNSIANPNSFTNEADKPVLRFDNKVSDYELLMGGRNRLRLSEIVGSNLLTNGVAEFYPKENKAVMNSRLFIEITRSSMGVTPERLLDNLDKGVATCLEGSAFFALAASLLPQYRNLIENLQIVGLSGENSFFGGPDDPKHFGVVVTLFGGMRGVSIGGSKVIDENHMRIRLEEARKGNLEISPNIRRLFSIALRMLKKVDVIDNPTPVNNLAE